MSDRFYNATAAAAIASAAAGPLFFAIRAVGAILEQRPDRIIPNPIGIVPFIAIVAPVCAFFPNLIGLTALGRLGRSNIGFRHPAMWAMTGGALAGVPLALLDASAPSIQAATAMGASSALLCRLLVHWRDPQGVRT